MIVSISILEFTNSRKEESFTTKERKLIILKHLRNLSIMMLLGICIAYAYSSNVYAASATINRNGYLYIPKSVGCPRLSIIYNTYTTFYYDYDPVERHTGQAVALEGDHCSGRSTGYYAIHWYTPVEKDGDDYWESQPHYIVVDPSPVIDGDYIRYRMIGVFSWGNNGVWATGSLSGMSYPSYYWDYLTKKTVPYTISVNTWGSSHASFTTVAGATCTEAAKERCSRCRLTRSTGEPLGHAWGALRVLKEATVYEAGSGTHVCERNSGHTETVEIPQKHFQIYAGGSQIQKVYLGEELVMDAASGEETLVK